MDLAFICLAVILGAHVAAPPRNFRLQSGLVAAEPDKNRSADAPWPCRARTKIPEAYSDEAMKMKLLGSSQAVRLRPLRGQFAASPFAGP